MSSQGETQARVGLKERMGVFLRSPFFMLLRVLGVLLLGDALLRLVFFLYNSDSGWNYEGGEVPRALLLGVRFDLAAIAIFDGLVILAMALPFRGMLRGVRVLNLLVVLFHFPVAMLNGIDVIYFGFSGKRLSHELFTGGKDLANFSVVDLLQYWWLMLLVVLISVGQVWWLNRAARRVMPWGRGWKVATAKWSTPILTAGLLFLAFRGGWSGRPMRPANAFVTSSLFLGNVTLNSAYTVVQSLEIGNEPDVELMPAQEAIAQSRQLVRNDFDGPFTSEEYPLWRETQFTEPERPYNVVILIVESFNASKVGSIQGLPLAQSLTPNLDTLARHGRLYTNFYSNGSRSVQSLPAIFNSSPDLFERPIIGSSFETNQQWGIGNMLLRRGYQTSFVCGGPNGTMGFDSFSKVCGFEQYYGRKEYPGDQSISGNWGVHDAGVLRWLGDLQEGFKKPFLNVWFSISNHHPFDLPADCPKVIAESGQSAMDKTVRYTDWALGEYFQRVRKSAWAANTIFMVTGDHCFYFENDPDRGDVQDFHVPLLLIGPGVTPGVDDREGSHVSILPTLIELLRLKTGYAGVGVSLLSQSNHSFSLTSVMGVLSLSARHLFVRGTLENILSTYRYADGRWSADAQLSGTPEAARMHEQLRAVYQVCSYMRKNNKQNMLRN